MPSMTGEPIILAKQRIRDGFLEFHREFGYQNEPSVPLISGDLDKTVIFTGSSTNVFKKYLLDTSLLPESGVALYQRKIRTQNYGSFFDDSIPEFNSFFEGGGALVPAQRATDLFTDIVKFLTLYFGIDSKDLIFKAWSQSRPALELEAYNRDNNLGLSFEFDGEKDSYYKWQFGQPGLSGEGITIALKKFDTALNGEIGTFVAISKERVGVVAAEWGFGTETLLSRVHGLRHPASFSTISEILPFQPIASHIKFCDALTTCVAILDEGEYHDLPGGVRTVLRRYVKALSFFKREIDISDAKLETNVRFLCTHDFTKNKKTASMLLAFLAKRGERERQFTCGVERLINGNPKLFRSLEGVKRSIRTGEGIDIFALAESYDFTNLMRSRFFKTVLQISDQNGFLTPKYLQLVRVKKS